VLPWLGRHRDERFFLWVHLVGPHDPYAPEPRFAKRFDTGYRGPIDGGQAVRRVHRKQIDLPPAAVAHVVSLYDGEIAQVDERIGAILDEIDAQGLRDDTLVVLTSDHGEELYQHNRFFLHAWSIYDSVLHVPLLLRLPGVLPAGRQVDGVIRIEDIAPTILALVGIAVPESFEGESLLPAIQTGRSASSRFVISELGPGIVSLRSDRWHYIYNPKGYSSPATIDGDRGDRGLFQIETEELYDVARDPRETRNLAADRPEVAAELRERAERWLAEDESDFQPYDVNPELLEELRVMGYVD
jgi:arylsulfatase A-like enzyme